MRPDKQNEELLIDLLLETNLSIAAIAKELGKKEFEIRKDIKRLGLEWAHNKTGSISRGQAALTTIMRKLLPGVPIVNEEPIGERLRLDVYCPRYKLAAEYHGRQHFDYVEYFHDDIYGFQDSLKRDGRKIQICEDLGITLVVFRYNDKLTEEAVLGRLLEAIKTAPVKEPTVKEYKLNPYYEAYKSRQREYRKLAYKRMKNRG